MSIFGAAKVSIRKRWLLAVLVAAAQLAVTFSPLAIAPAANALNVSSTSFDFSSAKRDSARTSNPSSLNGYAYYANVATVDGVQIDAKVTTVAITNATIDNYDAIGNATSNDSYFQINNTASAANGKTSFKFEFFDAVTGQPVVLQNMKVTAIDLDSPGRQFAEFSGFQSYVFSSSTKMAAYTVDSTSAALGNGLVRFTQDRVAYSSAASSNNDPWAAVEVDFAQLTSFVASFGNEQAQAGYFGLTFNSLCNVATGSACVAAAGVNNPNNTAPTSANTSLNYLNDGTTWTTLPIDNFPYSDVDSNPFAQVQITLLPSTGTFQRFVNGAWAAVSLNDVITAADISAGYLRYSGTLDAAIRFKVYDGLAYSAEYTLSLVASLTAQTISFTQPANKAPSFSTFASGATATSGLAVTLTSQTPSVCTVSGTSIVAVTGATGTCTITASQPGSLTAPFTWAAATSVTQSFQVTSLVAQTITLATPLDQTWSGTQFAVTPAVGEDATSHLAVTVVSLTTNICTVVYNAHGATAAVTVLGTGNCQLRASQAGNSTYAPATPVVVAFNITSGGSSSYTVTFNNNGGSGTMTAQSASSATNLTANTFTNTGYTFGGWSTTANGSLAYANSASYPFTSSTTLYAIWTSNAPAAPTLPAAPTITVPAGTTIGTAPTTLTPSINAPGGIASRCLVDPADNVCKQTVTIPGKGTFVLNSNGTVTFTAVLGWTGTATVQYRVTDASGQSAEAPVTVTVVAPAAPTVTGGTGTTITTVPANVTPQVSGLGSICLIDPADNVCKQTVTIPGKGTFVLNSNGTVTFTAVAGFIGSVTVQLQITTAYGQVARGPVTFIVGPTSQLQTGATTGTTPVNLAPSTKPEAGSACLVDPSDSGCKNVVTVPSVGTWNLNPSTGAVTFKAVEGYVGTTIVQYRVTRAGFDPTLTPFVVTVAKKRPPVTVTIGGFNPGSPILTTEIKRQIAAFMKAYVGYKTIECIGFTMGPSVLKVDKWLSTTRASNSCDYILKTLKSKVTALPLKNKMETVVGSLVRRITLTLRD